jgi:electron transport complex protein RnfB
LIGVASASGIDAINAIDAIDATSAIDAIDALLPQTQCTRCGFPDCHAYASAIVLDAAPIDQCPPGGAEGISRLAQATGRNPSPLNAEHGLEGPLRLAVIDEAWCIGCTLCLKACPVDCIVGGPKAMHTVVDALCTGCELCIPACPVDCISLIDISGPLTGWAAWSPERADEARDRYGKHQSRLESDAASADARLAAQAAALVGAMPQ